MKLIHLAAISMFCLLPSCGSSRSPQVIVEAPNYKPIGEGMKYLALATLGSAVVFSIASMVNNGKDDYD